MQKICILVIIIGFITISIIREMTMINQSELIELQREDIRLADELIALLQQRPTTN